jgi:hypothetical protein
MFFSHSFPPMWARLDMTFIVLYPSCASDIGALLSTILGVVFFSRADLSPAFPLYLFLGFDEIC